MSNIKYHVAFIELLVLSIFIITLNFMEFTKESFPLLFTYYLFIAMVYTWTVASIFLLIMLYRCSQIHDTEKNNTYLTVLSTLKKNRNSKNTERNDSIKSSTQPPHNKNIFARTAYSILIKDTNTQLACYVWMRNNNSQRCIHAFTAIGALLSVNLWGTLPFILLCLTYVLLLYGFLKLAQGTMEVV